MHHSDSATYTRWRRLSQIVVDLERAFEAACRIDQLEQQARTVTLGPRAVPVDLRDAYQQAEKFERRLTWIEQVLEREIDRLTAERLIRDLAERKRQLGLSAAGFRVSRAGVRRTSIIG